MSFLAFDEIHKSYGDKHAVRGVSFEVAEGEVFGLLGPNGAGKTTLIRILMDIIRPNSGSVSVFGRSLGRDDLDQVGYLPEDRGLYTKQKVLGVMTYFGALKGMPRSQARSEARQWLEKMDLAETEGWRVERLSKGMSQKVQIASTLLSDPRLCVLDEPFSGLDPVNVRFVQELIRERRREGKTTILSTHQMNMVEALCDRVALIHDGRLMVFGEVGEVRRRYSLPEVRVAVDGELPEVAGVESATSEGNSTWRLRLGDGTRAQDVLSALVANGASVSRFEKILAPMDEVFVRVVKGDRA